MEKLLDENVFVHCVRNQTEQSKYDSTILAVYRTYESYLGWFIFNLQILCENESTVLVTLKEGKVFGEVSA